MKKLLFIACLLFSSPVYAEDFITALGAECAKIIYNHSRWIYPTRFDNENSFNKQFAHLEKCLFLYKDNGGNIEILNKLYERATTFEKSYFFSCLRDKARNNNNNEEFDKLRDSCMQSQKSVWEDVMSGKECDLYTDDNIFYINHLLSHCKKD